MTSVSDFLSSSTFMPHGHCYLWRPEILWLHVVSDAMIALAYFTIPFALVTVVRKRRDLPFNAVFWLFALFIFACGASHVSEIWTTWYPNYGAQGLVKLITAIVSVATAIVLRPLVPRIISMPSMTMLESMNQKLNEEVSARSDEVALMSTMIEAQKQVNDAGLDYDRCVDIVLRQLCELLKADGAAIEMLDGDELSYREANGILSCLKGSRLSVSESLSGYCTQSGEMVFCPDVDKDERVHIASCRRAGIRSMMLAPVRSEGRIIGIIKTAKSQPSLAGSREARILEFLAGLHEAALARALAYKAGQKLLDERSQELQMTTERLRTIFDASLVGILLAKLDGQILEANEAYLKLIGYSRDDLMQNRIDWRQITPADDLKREEPIIESAMQGLAVEPYEKRYIRPNGDIVHVLVGFTVINYKCREAVAFTLDITEQKKAAQALRDSEARFQTITEALPQLVWATNAEGYIDYCNQGWYEFTGRVREGDHDRTWLGLVHPEQRERVRSAWRASVESHEPFSSEFQLHHVSGRYRWVLSRALPVHADDGSILRWLGTCTDIEDQKVLENKLRDANRLKDEFLATLSHELRTPLTAILGHSELLMTSECTAEEISESMESIYRNGRAQLKLIEDLLDVSRIVTGAIVLYPEPISLRSVIESAVHSQRPAAEAAKVLLSWQCEPSLLVQADALRLQQIIWNLLSNAIKFNRPTGSVTLSAKAQGSSALITVKDSGMGIEADFLSHVFERFRQEDGSHTRRHGGLGLGLAIVKHLVELHGGSITVTSEGRDQGSSFSFDIPLA